MHPLSYPTDFILAGYTDDGGLLLAAGFELIQKPGGYNLPVPGDNLNEITSELIRTW
jgi:hypothetical protein